MNKGDEQQQEKNHEEPRKTWSEPVLEIYPLDETAAGGIPGFDGVIRYS